MSYCLEIQDLPKEIPAATKSIVDYLLHTVCPALRKIGIQFQDCTELDTTEENLNKTRNVYLLSASQIKKCILNFLEILRIESSKGICIMESRLFTLDRLNWCISKLDDISKYINDNFINGNPTLNISVDLTVTPMYFVNWIDYTFDILSKLASSVYRTDYKDDQKVFEQWKNEMIDHITSLHMCIDELLLSAMTLCKYCLEEDQPALKARCHVVLRETKLLFNELVAVDITKPVKITTQQLKLPIMPSNVNILIDVLKDVLYVLETNTNTALLTLLIHCYAHCKSPVDVLLEHFIEANDQFCPCCMTNMDEIDIETCKDVKNFDLYNERLLQIGSFAVSCSSDQKRIISLRSCLSSLECLDPHLVPAISTSPNAAHTALLMNFWKQEVMEIRDTVFLIVDPVAFVERCKLYMKELLLEVDQQNFDEKHDIWAVIVSIGSIVFTFFSVYKKYEPNALIQNNDLDVLIENLDKAQRECKVVFDMLMNDGSNELADKANRRPVSIDKFSIRVRLLYSLIKKIHELFLPKDDDQLFAHELCEEELVGHKNVTHTILNTNTIYSQKKTDGNNMTRSIFARTQTVKNSCQNEFLSKLTKHLKVKKCIQQELNFSAQVSELFKMENRENKPYSKGPEGISLRRELLRQSRSYPFTNKLNSTFGIEKSGDRACKESILNETTSLQISAILNQLNDITNIISTTSCGKRDRNTDDNQYAQEGDTQLLGKGVALDNISSASITSNVTLPSNVTTLERISDLDLVESKLYSLKIETQLETNLLRTVMLGFFSLTGVLLYILWTVTLHYNW